VITQVNEVPAVVLQIVILIQMMLKITRKAVDRQSRARYRPTRSRKTSRWWAIVLLPWSIYMYGKRNISDILANPFFVILNTPTV